MIYVGAQYYRPPTPYRPDWARDFARMKRAGLNSVQLWAVWGWMEPEPGRFVFDDYDRLVELAGRNGLRVIISTITDLQPLWVPRVYPGTHMVSEDGQPVRGTSREECLPGLTPGHCTDHAEIREGSARFMRELAAHYRSAPALAAWDCWNETRWCVCCDRWVCYCPASLRAFREFLRARYGSLEALGDAWGLRLTDWDDVLPARNRTFLSPSGMDWHRWLMQRAADMGRWRRDAIKAGDPTRPISAHSPMPVTNERGLHEEPHFARGNDFDIAPAMDTFGTSAFPAWYHEGAPDPARYNITLEVTRSVAGGKPFWVSELQGGAFSQGFYYGVPVSGALQQYWTWSAIGRGAKAVVYWSWRDEIWGVESGGYGIDGNDGLAADRQRALRQTRRLLDAHGAELDAYRPEPSRVGVVFDSDSALVALLNRERNAGAVTQALNGTLSALERAHVPFDLLDGRNLKIPRGMRLLALPGAFVLKPAAAGAVMDFLRGGGWVYAEGGTGAFRENGFWIDDAAGRPLVGDAGIGASRRRGNATDAACTVPAGTWPGSPEVTLQGSLWSLALLPPAGARVLARDDAGDAMLVEVKVGKGRLVMSGTCPAHAYGGGTCPGFEDLLGALLAQARAQPAWSVTCDGDARGLAVRSGTSGRKRFYFLLNAGDEADVELTPAGPAATTAREWVTGATLRREAGGGFRLRVPGPGHRILELGA